MAKVQMGSYIVENAKIRYDQGIAGFFYYSKSKN